ncbi:MAG: hypothetical protein QHC67_09545 [Sphingobium sp.]|uniref:hypothetical protein n=1 Tax=Sphingobium sp. TaxID=1912891 RepID=UPI0029B50901|nr:hypothetical protein [Sphingobium sp.]MDX3910050.1 hypothetical protein [Sphingobium sp.]
MPVARNGYAALLLLAGLSACAPGERSTLENVANGANTTDIEETVEAQALSVMEPLNPPAPGTPGGLPDDRAPLIEGPIDPGTPQGAAQVVQGYYGLLEAKRFDEAQDLWRDGTDHGDEPAKAFAQHFAGFSEIHANIGAPLDSEGAAGSVYVTVPVQVYARVKATGKPYYALRSVVLRRTNDVPGSTAEQRRWHVYKIGAWPSLSQTPPKPQ